MPITGSSGSDPDINHPYTDLETDLEFHDRIDEELAKYPDPVQLKVN